MREEAARAEDRGEGRDLVGRIMRRQVALSLRIAAVFILMLVAIPLLNAFAPGLMATRVGGFTLTWLLLAVLFYPLTWALSRWFVGASDRIEREIVAEEALREDVTR